MATSMRMGPYQRYKLDTTRFILWLVRTARSCGHSIQAPFILELELERLKIAPTTPSKNKYSITTEKILELARFIGEHDREVPIHPQTWESFKRAVRIRRRYSEYYAKASADDSNDKDLEGHRHFITVLVQCSKLLSGRLRVQATTSHKTQQTAAATANTFGGLTMYETVRHAMEEQISEEVEVFDSIEESGEDNEDQTTGADSTLVEIRDTKMFDPQEELDFRKRAFLAEVQASILYSARLFDDSRQKLDDFTPLVVAEAVVALIPEQAQDVINYAVEHSLPNPTFLPQPGDELHNTMVTVGAIQQSQQNRSLPYLMMVAQLYNHDPSATQDHIDDHEYLVQYMMELHIELRVRNDWSKGEKTEEELKKPLLSRSLDGLTSTFWDLMESGTQGLVLLVVADILRRVRLTNRIDRVTKYTTLLREVNAVEKQYVDSVAAGIMYPSTARDVDQYSTVLRGYITQTGFERFRYFAMRQYPDDDIFGGIHHAYPVRHGSPGDQQGTKTFLDNKGISDVALDPARFAQLQQFFVLPPKDGRWLRMVNPALRSKLSLCMWLNNEEAGLHFANASIQGFAVAHLYNALQQQGKITALWPEMEQFMEYQKASLFLGGERPTASEKFLSNFLRASGFPDKMVNSTTFEGMNKKARYTNFTKMTTKRPELKSHPLSAIIRDYIYEKTDLRPALSRLDTEMTKCSQDRNLTSIIEERGILAFIIELGKSKHLPAISQTLHFDYVKLTRKCNELCHRLDLKFGREVMSNGVETKEHWNKPTIRGWGLAFGVLQEVDMLARTGAEATMSKKKFNALMKNFDAAVSTVVIDGTVEVVQEFIARESGSL